MACLECGKAFTMVLEKFEYHKDIKRTIAIRVFECPNRHLIVYANTFLPKPYVKKPKVVIQKRVDKLTLEELRLRKKMKPLTKRRIKENFITIHKGEE